MNDYHDCVKDTLLLVLFLKLKKESVKYDAHIVCNVFRAVIKLKIGLMTLYTSRRCTPKE